MSSRSEIDILRRIATVARKFTLLPTCCSFPPFPVPSEDVPPADPVFPAPEPLTSDLLAFGLDLAVAQKISEAFMQAALRMKQESVVQFRRASRALNTGRHASSDTTQLQTRLRSAYVSTYTKMLQNWVNHIVELGARAAQAKRAHHCTIGVPSPPDHISPRHPFNQAAIPTLVRFFEHNAFPSQSEKRHLATQTGMDYKQIKVWFQNRRNRLKKDGKDLKRGAAFAGLPSELGNIVAEIFADDDITDNGESSRRCSHCADGCLTLVSAVSTDTLNLNRPPHAYPSSYPPSCPYNPFPIKGDMRKFSTPWFRTPSSLCKHSPSPVDITQLTSLFAKMSLLEEASKSRISRIPSSQLPNDRPGSSILPLSATAVPRAPLPSFLPITSTIFSSDCAVHSSGVPSWSRHCSLPSHMGLLPAKSTSHTSQIERAVSERESSSSPQSVASTTVDARCEVLAGASTVSLSSLASNSTATSNVSWTKLLNLHDSPCNVESDSPVEASEGASAASSSHTLSSGSDPMPSPSGSDSPVQIGYYSLSTPTHHGPYPPSRNSKSRRKFAALPKRLPTTFKPLVHRPSPHEPSDSSRSISTVSRMSSTNSISSVSSSESNSTSSGESDGLLTPPSLTASLPNISAPAPLGQPADPDYITFKSSVGRASPIGDVQLDIGQLHSIKQRQHAYERNTIHHY